MKADQHDARHAKKIECKAFWSRMAKDALVGRTIKVARYVDQTNVNYAELQEPHLMLVLDDGTVWFVVADDEWNEPGTLHCVNPSKKGWHGVLPRLY